MNDATPLRGEVVELSFVPFVSFVVRLLASGRLNRRPLPVIHFTRCD
jgi:hypothetical protein